MSRKMSENISALLFVLLNLAIAFLSIEPCAAQTAVQPSGSGTSTDPYLIATLDNLAWLQETANDTAWGRYYKQTANIDASPTSTWNSNGGSSPIGNSSVYFTGTYDGSGYTITGLYISRSSTNYVGLFGYTRKATIDSIGLVNVNITGQNYVASLVGNNEDSSTISSTYITGSVSGSTVIGGLVGNNDTSSTVSNSYCTASVSGSFIIGGLVGENENLAATSDCYSTGSVSGISIVGGFAGYDGAGSAATNCFWNTTTSGQSGSAGGTGKSTAEMTNPSTFDYAGWDSTMWHWAVSVNSGYPYLEWQNLGGISIFTAIAPSGSGTSSDPYQIDSLGNLYWLQAVASGSAWGSYYNKYYKQTADINASSDTSWNSGAGFSPIGNSSSPFNGGGYDGNWHTITGLYIRRSSTDNVGLFGEAAAATIVNLGLINVYITGHDYAGGLVGLNLASTVSNCYSTGSVNGSTYAGGLIGMNLDGLPTNCYSTASVIGSSCVGGLAGVNGGSTISNCYSTGSVSGSSNVGGIVGATGTVIGADPGSVNDCFWDITTSNQSTSAYGTVGETGETDAAMKTRSTYAGWDFTNTWTMNVGFNNGYPFYVIFHPEPTISVGLSNVGPTSATLAGTVTVSEKTVVRFLWGTASGVYVDSILASPDTVSGDTATSVSANITGLSAGNTYYYTISDSNAYGYYRGSENSFVAGNYARWGDALSFASGQSAYYSSTLPVYAALTLECWVNWDGTTGTDEGIVYNGNTSSDGFGIYINSSGQLSILVGGISYTSSTDTLKPGAWTHLALVRSGGWTLYDNGVSIATSNASLDAPSGNFFVGGNYNGGSPIEYFNGRIDEVRYSDVERYTSNFATPSSPFTTDANTVVLYHFNEGSGTVAYDSSGSGYNLTLYGGVTWATSDISLPVQATDFLVTADIGSVTLSWKTQSEVNNAGFNVLREDPGASSYHIIATYTSNDNLRGLGTSSTGRSYDFTDNHVVSGSTYQYKIRSVSTDGTTKDLSTLSVTVDAPKTYALYQNYPNPFNPTTAIGYQLSAVSHVTLKVYDVLGREVATLVDGQQNAGVYKVSFDGSRFASGVYFYRIVAEGNNGQRFISIKKLVLMK
jgi:hypothetical protein